MGTTAWTDEKGHWMSLKLWKSGLPLACYVEFWHHLYVRRHMRIDFDGPSSGQRVGWLDGWMDKRTVGRSIGRTERTIRWIIKHVEILMYLSFKIPRFVFEFLVFLFGSLVSDYVNIRTCHREFLFFLLGNWDPLLVLELPFIASLRVWGFRNLKLSQS